MPEPRVFTLEEVNALVPRLARLVAGQLERRNVIEAELRELSVAVGFVPTDLAVSADDSREVVTIKRRLAERVAEYQRGWTEVEELGGVLKDTRLGLIDFYGRVDGKLVWLCWKHGEPEVSHYHGLDEGFSARKPIRTSLRIRLLN
jgi:hypothetical protein